MKRKRPREFRPERERPRRRAGRRETPRKKERRPRDRSPSPRGFGVAISKNNREGWRVGESLLRSRRVPAGDRFDGSTLAELGRYTLGVYQRGEERRLPYSHGI